MHKLLDRSHCRRGMMLVVVVWIVLILTVIAYSLAYEVRIGLKMTVQNQKRLRAQGLAKTGLAKAVMDLRNDRLIAMADRSKGSDTPQDVWAKDEDKTEIKYAGGTYTVRIIDEERKLNVNNIQVNSIRAMQSLLEEMCGIKGDDGQEIAQALVDFKDPDTKTCGQKAGDEIEYYTDWGLKKYGKTLPEGWIFRPKNDNLISIDELLEVPGITREMLYGNPEKVSQDPLDRLESKKESTALADYLTVSSSGVLNLETCSLPVLEAALAGATGGNIDVKPMAAQIDKVRGDRSKIKKGEYQDLITQLKNAGIDLTMMNSSFPVGVASTYFTIIVRGEYEGVRVTQQALVQVSLEPYNLNPDDKTKTRKRDHKAIGSLKNQPYLIIDPAVRVVHFSEL